MLYLLDTNVLSDLMRHPDGRIADAIEKVDSLQVCTSIIVVAELRFGIAKARSRRLMLQLAAILRGLDVVAFEAPADEMYSELRASLERTGTPIGGNDMLIAAQALTLGLTLVTDNEREFSRAPNFQIENWLR